MVQLFGDFELVAAAIMLIFVYANIVLGSCSPIFMRSLSAMVGLACVILSVITGYAVASIFNWKASLAHNILPFMLLGIGVDDMFVIVSCIDQAPLYLSANERFRIGLRHAGPSITVTSVTDALAFFFGALSSFPGLRSFCVFAGFCVVALYFSFLTIFSPWFVNDLRRQHKLKGDCCGLCCCKEDVIICCKGKLLSDQQK